RRAREAPGVVRVGEGAASARAAERELRQVRFADEHSARALQPRDNGGIEVGDEAVEHPRVRGRADALGVMRVFDAERDAVQRTTIPAGADLALRVARGSQRLLARDGDERADSRVETIDA